MPRRKVNRGVPMTDLELFSRRLDRRSFLGAGVAGATSLALAACTTTDVVTPPVVAETPATPGLGDPATMYAARVDEGYNLPAIPFDRVDPKFYRQVVDNPTGEAPGTIVVDTSQHFLYLVQPGGKAIRYGVSLGKAGFGWTGSAVVQWKKKWPTWTPPAEMVERDPNAAKWKDGMPGGPDNPLGARAMYLHENGHDTIYRIHGTSQPWSIGLNISSGCIRMVNDEITDLYDQVEIGAKVIVLLQGAALYKGV